MAIFPAEILLRICDFIAERSALRALAVISRLCREIAYEKLYHTFILELRTNAKLTHDIQIATGLSQYIRILVIGGNRHLIEGGPQDIFIPDKPVGPWQSAFAEQARPAIFTAFKNIANLISWLPKVTDVIYNCENSLPFFIFDAVQSRQNPPCRLHHNTLYLRNPLRFNGISAEIEASMSPYLHSVRALIKPYASNAYVPGAIREMVASLAPNLNQVFVYAINGNPLGDQIVSNTQWDGFRRELAEISKAGSGIHRGSLEALFIHYNEVDEGMISWFQVIDLSKLRVLELGTIVTYVVLQYLAVHSGEFVSLQILSMLLFRFRDRSLTHEQYSDAATDLISKLPSLEALRLIGAINNNMLNQIFESKGNRLRRLHLECNDFGLRLRKKSQLGNAEMKMALERCPNLEEFAIQTWEEPSPGRLYEVVDGKLVPKQFPSALKCLHPKRNFD